MAQPGIAGNATAQSQAKKWVSDNLAGIALLVPLSLLLVIEAVLALQWRMVHDTPMLHYVAFLIDHYDFVPYRDVFETSFPGTFLFHLAIGKLFGYGDTAFRWIDLTWLILISFVTWNILSVFGRRVAWASVVLFGLSYLQRGPALSLQRDAVGVLPIAVAVCNRSRGG